MRLTPLMPMRLFIALELPNDVRATLAATQLRLRQRNLAVAWSAVAGIHLTLQFLGETAASLVPDLVAILSDVPVPTYRLHLARLGAFPSIERPRVLWVGLGGDLAPLIDLQQRLTVATHRLGFLPEDRPFTPHLTLGRLRPQSHPAQVQAITAALRSSDPPAAATWMATPPRLFQSISTPQGMVYTVIGP